MDGAIFLRIFKNLREKIRARFLKKIDEKSREFQELRGIFEVPHQFLREDTSQELKSAENRPKSMNFLKKNSTDFFCALLKKM